MKPILKIANWHDYQHYGDRRRMVWIKTYVELLMNDRWCAMTDESRAHLLGLWLLATYYDGEIPFNPDWIARQINAKRAINWSELVCSQFITLNESASALVGLQASLDKNKKEEEEKKREERARRATQIVRSFTPSDDVRRWAAEEFPTVSFDREVAAFVDHHTAKGSTFKDWDAALRNWIRNAQRFGKERPTTPPAAGPVVVPIRRSE